jgi:hypothetical protein
MTRGSSIDCDVTEVLTLEPSHEAKSKRPKTGSSESAERIKGLKPPSGRKNASTSRDGKKRQTSGKHASLTPAHKRAAQVYRDMLQNPSLSFTKAARKRKVDPRTVLHHFQSNFEKDSSGRLKARSIGRKRQTLYIPWFEPGQEIPIRTKDARERRLIGRWMAALNAAGRGDFSKMDKFPRNQTIGGVTLPTARNEVQRILEALAEKESPYEGLYRTRVRPS